MPGALGHMRLPKRALRAAAAALLFGALAAVLAASPSYAASAWWHLSSGARPSVLKVGSEAQVVAGIENLGDADARGEISPIKIKDMLPSGLKALAIEGTVPQGNTSIPIECELSSLSCTLREPGPPFEERLAQYGAVELRIAVQVESAVGGQNEVSVSGGGAPPASLRSPLTVGEGPVPFGLQESSFELEEEGGTATTQAGAHPFQLTNTLNFNQTADKSPVGEVPPVRPQVLPSELARDVAFKLPPGLIGNPTAVPRCTIPQFYSRPREEVGTENECPDDTAIGIAVVNVNEPSLAGALTFTVPLFNLEPAPGEPARFGFYVIAGNAPVLIDTALRTGDDYGVTASVTNISQTASFLSSSVTFWGVPGDPRHDPVRGWRCLEEDHGEIPPGACAQGKAQHPTPFLSMPTKCASTSSVAIEADSWAQLPRGLNLLATHELPALDGCNRLAFNPSIELLPDGQAASTPTGLAANVRVPQEGSLNASGLASSNIRSIAVTLPEGVKLNPAAADGLEACNEQRIGYLPATSTPPEDLHFTPALPTPFCPDAAKVGTVKIKTPLLPDPLEGAVYLATPAPNGEGGQNPFGSLVAMYIVAEDPVSGSLVKLPGRVSLNQQSGRITTTFENTPQLAFELAELHFFGGSRAPLATPAHCGTYTTNATFVPWSGIPPVGSESQFQILTGPNGSPCPGVLPFAPSLAAGTSNINAGAFTPLSTTLSREDGQQDIQAVRLHMPAGLSGVIAGVKLCPEAQANAGICGPESEIGHTIVSVGLGGDPFTVTGGQVFLTESYKGSPYGLSIVNPAKAGPFDLGKVIVRAKLDVDPHTAALTVTTDADGPYAIPHILDGIPLQIKHVNVTIDRPNFTFNPTNCTPAAIDATLSSAEGASAPSSVPFQVTNCANLKFAPKFSVSTSGHTSKASGASLSVKLTYPKAPFGTYANVARVKVALPKQLPSRLTTLQKACTAAVFDANPSNCPSTSIVGHAKVITPLLPVPLEGPAYFVSHGGEAFPDLTIVLKGYGVTVDLVGSTQIKNGVTTSTFKATPDVPFNSFELTLPQGKYSALAANANLCKSKLTMPTEFTAQNGLLLKQQTKIAVSGCPHSETRAQKLAKAIKVCRKKKNHARRLTCERQARKKYAAKAPKRAKSHR
jgi:hypothetical protein